MPPTKLPYWDISDAARQRIDREFARNAHRSWDPLGSRPSLADLTGCAKDYSNRYRDSRASLFRAAGVRVRYLHVYCPVRRTIISQGVVRALPQRRRPDYAGWRDRLATPSGE